MPVETKLVTVLGLRHSGNEVKLNRFFKPIQKLDQTFQGSIYAVLFGTRRLKPCRKSHKIWGTRQITVRQLSEINGGMRGGGML